MGTRWRRYSADARTSDAGSATSSARLRRRANRRGLEPRAVDHARGATGEHGPVAHSAEADAHAPPHAVRVARADGGHADDGKIAVAARVLDDDRRARLVLGQHHAGQHVGRLERGGVRALEEVGGGDAARTGGPRHLQGRAERHGHQGHLAGGIGVAEGAAQRAAVANLAVTDERNGARQQRQSLGHRGRPLERRVSRESADEDVAVRRSTGRTGRPGAGRGAHRCDLNLVQAGNAVEIDDRRRPHEAHVEQRDQALASRETSRGAVVAPEGLDGCLHAVHGEILEGRRLHGAPSGGCAAARWPGCSEAMRSAQILRQSPSLIN